MELAPVSMAFRLPPVRVTRFVGAGGSFGGDRVAKEEERDISGVGSLDLEGEDDWREFVGWCSGVEVTAVDGINGAEERGKTKMGGLASVDVAVTGSGAI